MPDRPLSIHEAAIECPNRTALIFEDREYTFKELSQLIHVQKDHTDPFAPGFDLTSLIRIYSGLEMGRTLFLLHSALTRQERENIVCKKQELSNAAAVLFTSGTTSTPKGVILSYEALIASARANTRNLGWQENDRWLLNLPLAHVGGLSIITRCLIARKPVIVGIDVRRSIEHFGATILSLVPTQLQRISKHTAPSSVRSILLGGAPCPSKLRDEAIGHGWPILPTYGMTETSSQIATYPVSSGEWPEKPAAGRLLDGVEAKVINEEIMVRGPMLFSGYYGFPARGKDDWFPTGDLGRIEDRWIYVTGRKKELIITGGENVSPHEVEEVLVRNAEIEAIVVFGVPDDKWGERVVAAYCGTASSEQLVEDAKASLATFKRPKAYFQFESFPLLDSGKIARKEIRRLVLEKLTF